MASYRSEPASGPNAPTSWSAAECIANLRVSTELFLPVLRKAIAEARAKNLTTEKQPSMDVLGRVLRWFLEPPIRQRVRMIRHGSSGLSRNTSAAPPSTAMLFFAAGML
jgi:hypothetical protein